MGLIESVLENLGITDYNGNESFKISVFGDKAVYVEGVKFVLSYSCMEVVLRLKKGGIILCGENLSFKKICEGDVLVCGLIKKIERV